MPDNRIHTKVHDTPVPLRRPSSRAILATMANLNVVTDTLHLPALSPLDRLANRSPIRQDLASPIDWYIRLADWHLSLEPDSERARR